MSEYVTPQLRTVLKTFQDKATKSLQGPGLSLVHPQKKEPPSPETVEEPMAPPPPELPQPILSSADTGRGVLYETILEGKPIGCFVLGGEMRLCLPQILNNVLTNFSLEQINGTCEKLQIFCSQCTAEQLNEFKAANILPEDVKFSGLITRTNAERLCSTLLHRSERRPVIKGAISFRVYHRCFGKTEGICTPDMFSVKEPACIECTDCGGMFSPQRFVCHVHGEQEEQTCHWGFDSGNWRAYIHVAYDVENRDKYTKMLDELREREYQETLAMINQQRESLSLKRKAVIEEPHILANSIDIPQKKSKLIDDAAYALDYHTYHPYAQFYAHHLRQQHQQQLSAFRPWTPLTPKHLAHLSYSNVPGLPYLSQEPPILQNPERVVRLSECERFERTFQPNVALAPRRVNGLTKELSPRETTRIVTTDIPIKLERVTSPRENTLVGASPELRVTSPAGDGAPVSPEQMSGSNEITSSTSPVPLTGSQVMTNGVSPSPPRSAPDSHPPGHAVHLHHNHHQASGAAAVVLKNGGTPALAGNPEFELSTDTDDDSLTGEADSSITGSPWDVAAVAEALKDASPGDRDKVLHIIKVLVQENMQLRRCSAENVRLVQELRQKDDQIAELLLEQQRRQLPPPEPVTRVVVKSEPPEVSKTTEVIMKPLKKSARRSPEDTVVVMPPNKRYTLSAAVAAAEDIPDPPKESIKRVEMVNGVGGEHKARENGVTIQCKDSG
ncbi:ski oncogene [Lutzomyia longipalpis]|uniref:ski oncogene n=1 Tax=Lutzomyia longipalpis TaxID=7200 RepID=UPI002483E53B|nr:ski oncogene [Lutzomyia longipalpis]